MSIVALEGITQRFGDFVALDNVSLHVRKGDLHAVVGENGAGKTTLMRILYGALTPSEGRVIVQGQERHYRSSREAIADRIGMVSQHYAIIPELTCLQNLMLGAEPGAFMNLRQCEDRANVLAEQMGFTFDWHARAETLGPAGAQKLEILKLLWRDAEIMILDEPTAMLSPRDADALFESLRKLASQGATVILVTHRLPEVTEYCQRVTVLRGGKLIDDQDVQDLAKAQLAELIVGHALTAFEERELPQGETALNVQNLVVRGDRGNDAVKSASFQVRKGELVGLAGVDGNGQKELFHALMGTRGFTGLANLNGEDLSGRTTRDRLAAGVRIIAEDRHAEALVEEWSLSDNAVLGFQRLPSFRVGAGINEATKAERTRQFIAKFNTKCTSAGQAIGSLSGGNQQRFIAARALGENPSLVLAFQPARGLDIDATRAVYQGLRDACSQGAGALIVSFDLDELLEFCDRILVINGGVVSAPHQKERAEIGQLMVGAI